MLYIPTIISILEGLLVTVPVLLTVAFVTVAERKTMASMQRRLGPNHVGYYGLLQAFADALKLLLKEYVSPTQANIIIFFLGPVITLIFSLLGYAVIPYGPGLAVWDFNLGILYMLAVSSLATYFILLAGWSASYNNTRPFFLNLVIVNLSYFSSKFKSICLWLLNKNLNMSLFLDTDGGRSLLRVLIPFFIAGVNFAYGNRSYLLANIEENYIMFVAIIISFFFCIYFFKRVFPYISFGCPPQIGGLTPLRSYVIPYAQVASCFLYVAGVHISVMAESITPTDSLTIRNWIEGQNYTQTLSYDWDFYPDFQHDVNLHTITDQTVETETVAVVVPVAITITETETVTVAETETVTVTPTEAASSEVKRSVSRGYSGFRGPRVVLPLLWTATGAGSFFCDKLKVINLHSHSYALALSASDITAGGTVQVLVNSYPEHAAFLTGLSGTTLTLLGFVYSHPDHNTVLGAHLILTGSVLLSQMTSELVAPRE